MLPAPSMVPYDTGKQLPEVQTDSSADRETRVHTDILPEKMMGDNIIKACDTMLPSK